MTKVRAFFEKKGRAKYISHLDLNRCMQRCFKRSGIPIWYTEGFNPHIYINFALALSLGFESGCEIMDFNITEFMPFDEMLLKLNNAMPEGITVTKIYIPKTKQTDIAFSDFRVILSGDITEKLEKFFSQESIITIKKTKRGEKEIDLKPLSEVTDICADGENTALTLRLPAGNDMNINPTLITDLFIEYINNETRVLSVERTAVLNKDKEIFK